ncbi:MAG: hypothetical protein JO329_16110 [Planctomycetaceae bacterium]|nr:hypothetical protein [Planctomycetaceae bacterium]MBV8607555.1 hypothetical protein [Singulisphaera sp.]
MREILQVEFAEVIFSRLHYDEIGAILGKSGPNCRQLVSRAEGHIRERWPRFDPNLGEAGRITGEFQRA